MAKLFVSKGFVSRGEDLISKVDNVLGEVSLPLHWVYQYAWSKIDKTAKQGIKALTAWSFSAV